jgi:hypothetical protein
MCPWLTRKEENLKRKEEVPRKSFTITGDAWTDKLLG